MKLDRRNLIRVAGAGVALAAAGGYWRVTRMPETAYAPWAVDAKPLSDVRLDAFRYAILAPNPHNRQPWLIKLVGENEAILTIDLEKRLPITDPFDRQLTIGFGCFIELARIAAAERGVRVDIAPFPSGEPSPRLDQRAIARLTFTPDPDVQKDPLFSAILKRRSAKIPFSAAPSQKELAGLMTEGAEGSIDPALLSKLSDICASAIESEVRDPAAYQESVDLFRIGHAEIDANPDGIDLSGPMIEATALLGMTTRESAADTNSQAFAIGLDDSKATYGSVPGALWIKTVGNSRADQLEAGRRYVRANLRATQLGLSMHPVSQSLQEYAAMSRYYEAVHKLLGVKDGNRIQMLARLGRAEPVPPAPRWPLSAHLLR